MTADQDKNWPIDVLRGGAVSTLTGDDDTTSATVACRPQDAIRARTGSMTPGSKDPIGNHAPRPGDIGNGLFGLGEMTCMPLMLIDPNLPDNPAVFANRALQDITGYDQSEIVGRNWRFLEGADTDRETVAELNAAIEERRAIAVELLVYKRDGTPFWNAVHDAPVYDDMGKLIYFFATHLDITRRRMSDQSLRQAQKIASIGQLTAGLAHDFNNLLQVISGNLELLRSKLKDDHLHRYLDNGSAAVEHGARLTAQLLAFGQKTRLAPAAIDLNDLVTSLAEKLAGATGIGIDLRFDLARGLSPLLVDPVHLEKALLSVLANARDAMPNGGAVLVTTSSIGLDGSDRGALPPLRGDYVVLSVKDEGEGMSPWVLERATEPFFTTRATGRGSGLGLAMVHGFVEQSQGRLDIDSQAGRGTTVRMILPTVGGRVDAPRRRGADRPAQEVAAAGLPREHPPRAVETILVVDDSDDVLAIAREHLHGLGYRVLVARSGAEALGIIDHHGIEAIDLLFTDIVMPGGISGVMLAEMVRERLPTMPVLFTTGYNDELVGEGPRQLPIMDVLGKPYPRSELAVRVRAALKSKAGVRSG